MKKIILVLLCITLICVSTIHYVGFLIAEWLHVYVFEPAETKLFTWIERINP